MGTLLGERGDTKDTGTRWEGTGTWWDEHGDDREDMVTQGWPWGHAGTGMGTGGWAWGHSGEDAGDMVSPWGHLHSLGELHLVEEEGDEVPGGDGPQGHQPCPTAEQPQLQG